MYILNIVSQRYLSVSPPVYLLVGPPVYQSVCMSVCLSIGRFVCRSVPFLQPYPVLACPDAQCTNVANVQAVKMYNSWYTLYSLALLHIIYCNQEPKWLIKGCETYSNCSVFHYWLIHLKSYAKWSCISPWEICLVQHSPFLCCKWLSHDYWHHPHCRRSVICNQRSVSCLEE